MMNTAKTSMVVATLIGTIVFSDQVADKSNRSPKLFLAYSTMWDLQLCVLLALIP